MYGILHRILYNFYKLYKKFISEIFSENILLELQTTMKTVTFTHLKLFKTLHEKYRLYTVL